MPIDSFSLKFSLCQKIHGKQMRKLQMFCPNILLYMCTIPLDIRILISSRSDYPDYMVTVQLEYFTKVFVLLEYFDSFL